MKEIHETDFMSCSLYEVALRFRLLREQGLRVSPDVFDKFKGEDKSFNKDITNEPRGLLSLYNAAYLSIHGEPELDEAISFARHHLESMRGSLGYPLSDQVKRNLEIPLPRTLKRVDAPYCIVEYGQEKACSPSILELAKIEFNLLQRLHQRELKDFFRSKLCAGITNRNLNGFIAIIYQAFKITSRTPPSPRVFQQYLSLIGMGDEATEEAFEWAISCTDAVKACAELARFMNDMTAFEHGKNKMDVACSVDSYIKQYHVTGEVAMAAIGNLVEDRWKTINETRFERRAMLPLVQQIARLSKSMTLMYRGTIDLCTFTGGNKDEIQQLFVEAIPLQL